MTEASEGTEVVHRKKPGAIVTALKRVLVKYHQHRASKEADLNFYAVTLDYKNQELPLADLFSGLLCNEQLKWQTLLLVFAVYNMFYVPFTLFVSRGQYDRTPSLESMLEVFEKVGDVVFLFEVFFNFYLPYEEEGVQINVHTLVREKYLKGWFILDVTGALPLELPVAILYGNSQTTRWLRVNKLVRFFRLNFYWERMEKNLLTVNPALIRLGKFIFLFILVAHWVACLWLEFVRLEGLRAQKWLGVHDFEDVAIWTVWDRYCQAFNWALATMVGYGGTIPQTATESVFSFVVVVVGVVMYVVVIGTVGTIVLNLDSAENSHREKIENMNEFFRLKHLPASVVAKVHAYFDFMWRSRQGIDAVTTVNALPQYLKTDIAMYLCRDLVVKVSFFYGLSDHFFRQLVVQLTPLVCVPCTEVVVSGETGKEMYFIRKGSLDVTATHAMEDGTLQERLVCVLKEGQHFGELALLCKSKRTMTVRTREFCDLMVLTAVDFRVCIFSQYFCHRVYCTTGAVVGESRGC